MDIKTFNDVASNLPTNISILVRGDHGIGKSEIVKQIARRLNYSDEDIIDRRMSQMTEGDVIGLPIMDVERGLTKFLPAEFVKQACERPVLLFLDEINRATQEVMQACFQLCLDRELNGNKLHEGTRVVAAVNASANYQVNEMDPAFLDRFFVVELNPTAGEFFEHAESIGVDADLIRFLKENESRLEPSQANPGTVQPSRRSWVRLDAAFKQNRIYEQNVEAMADRAVKDDAASLAKLQQGQGRAFNFAVGFVGVEASVQLCDFLSKRESRFTALNVLGEYPKHRAKIQKLGQDKLNTLIDMIVDHSKVTALTSDDAKNMGLFVQDLPGELRVSFITNYTKGTRPTELFTQNFKTINPEVMHHIVAVFNDKEQAEKVTAALEKKRLKEEEDAKKEETKKSKKK